MKNGKVLSKNSVSSRGSLALTLPSLDSLGAKSYSLGQLHNKTVEC